MEEMISLWFYLSTFALSTLLIYSGVKYKKSYSTYIGIIIPIVVAAFRYNVGIDYNNYLSLFRTLSNVDLVGFLSSSLSSIYEHSSFYISHFALVFGPLSKTVFFGIYAIISTVFFYLGLKKVAPKYTWIGMLLYLFLFFPPSLNGMRQYAAISLAFYATIGFIKSDDIIVKRFLKYIVFIIAAMFLHTSAICALTMVPLYIIAKFLSKKYPKDILIISTIMMLLVVIIEFAAIKNIESIPVLNKYAFYLTWDIKNAPSPNIISKIGPVVLSILFFNFLNQGEEKSKNIFYFLTTFFALATSFIGFLVPYGYRISDYFIVFQIPLFISILNNINSSDKKRFFILMMIGYGLFYFLYSAALNNSHGIMPYQITF